MKRLYLLLAAMLLPLLTSCGSSNHPVVVMETSMGTVKMELYEDKSPVTVKNFLAYVDDGQYDGTVFHRVMEDFMIQGGGFDTDLVEKRTKGPIINESKNGVKNERGTLAMARTNDPDSATAQFFINVKDNPGLDGDALKNGYAVFGKVIEGMDVVDKIRRAETGTRKAKSRTLSGLEEADFENVPLENVIIKSIKRAKS